MSRRVGAETKDRRNARFRTIPLKLPKDEAMLRKRFGTEMWLLKDSNEIVGVKSSEDSDDTYALVFLREKDARSWTPRCPGTKPSKSTWATLLKNCHSDEALLSVTGPDAAILPLIPISYFLAVSDPESSPIRREHLDFCLETILEIRKRHPQARVSIWNPQTLTAARTTAVPADYMPNLSEPFIVVIAHPFSVLPYQQEVLGFYVDQSGQCWYVDRDGDCKAPEHSLEFIRRLIGFMNSPIAVLERKQGGTATPRSAEGKAPEVVIVQKRSMKYTTSTPIPTKTGPRTKPRCEYNVREHIRHQPLTKFGRDEAGKWKVTVDRIISQQTRCRGRAKPLVIAKVSR